MKTPSLRVVGDWSLNSLELNDFRERSVIDLMPRRQFGYINPVQISDFIHYQCRSTQLDLV